METILVEFTAGTCDALMREAPHLVLTAVAVDEVDEQLIATTCSGVLLKELADDSLAGRVVWQEGLETRTGMWIGLEHHEHLDT